MSQDISDEIVPRAVINNAIRTTRAMIKLHSCRINFSSIIIGIFMAETNRRLNWNTKMIDKFQSYQDYLHTCSNSRSNAKSLPYNSRSNGKSLPYNRVPCNVAEIEKMYELVKSSLEELDLQDHGAF